MHGRKNTRDRGAERVKQKGPNKGKKSRPKERKLQRELIVRSQVVDDVTYKDMQAPTLVDGSWGKGTGAKRRKGGQNDRFGRFK